MTAQADPRVEIIRRVPAFLDVPAAALADLIAGSPTVAYAPGDRLVAQSELSDFALILLEGEASILNESQRGATPIGTVVAPALVGEIGALARLPRTAGVTAVSRVLALKVGREALMEACRVSPGLLVAVVGQLGQRIDSMSRALGLYAGGLAALEAGDVDPDIVDDLNNPTEEVRAFASAFRRLAGRIGAERRLRAEMASAALIQQAMLPQDPAGLPLSGRCTVHGAMRPARHVGGDFFDVFMLDDDRLAVAVGDVCGKGVPASLFMSVTMTTLRLVARREGSVQDMVESANALLCEHNPGLMFATLVYGVLDLVRGRFEYVSCGHSPPCLLRADGAARWLPAGGVPLGMAPARRFPASVIDLLPGDGLVLYTDGVTESVDLAGGDYGEDRLIEVLARQCGRGARDLVDSVLDDVTDFSAGCEPFDDMTCLALRLGAAKTDGAGANDERI